MGYYNKLAYAIYNDIVTGLKGINSNPTISIELLEDDVIDERLLIIKEYNFKGVVPKKDLTLSINCITLDCKDMNQCNCVLLTNTTPTLHFEIPLLLLEIEDGIIYIGSIDKTIPFIYYTNPLLLKYHKFRKRTTNKPYVFIDTTPNSNNMYDCWVFNAPLLKYISVIGIFKDPRQVEDMGCCIGDIHNLTFIDAEIKKRLTEKKIRYYKQLATPITPNDQSYK